MTVTSVVKMLVYYQYTLFEENLLVFAFENISMEDIFVY